ncbi:MAG: response regulator [Anaerolineae bacterium]|nr:response regulator [Anaerolineae bacterium]
MAKKILVVEDEPETNFILMQMLQVSGFQTTAVYDGKGALAMVAAEKPDVVLLDIMMPGIDGWEVCRRIKENPDTSNVGIVFVTAYGGEDLDHRAAEVGADVILRKPVGLGQVIGAVSEVLGKHGKLGE